MLTVQDMKTNIRSEIDNIISRGDATILQEAVIAAEEEAKGYLSRFDITAVFSTTGTQRNAILLLNLKAMAKWHFIALSNPDIDYEDTKLRYDRAIEWLQGVQSGKIIPNGLPAAQPAEQSQYFHLSSNKKRNNHY